MISAVRVLRIKKGKTCKEMGAVIGVSKSNYSKKENGIINFSLEEAKVLSDFFGMQIEELFFE